MDDFDSWLAERGKDDVPAADVETLRPGQRIGAYRIIRQLGVGGMGQVYEAEHVALGVRRALKVFSTVSEHSEFLRKRFVAEGRILADLQHPQIVRVYDLVVDEDSGMAYFEMDLVLSPTGQPRTLADELQDGVDEGKIVGWFKDICEGLSYIHSQGVVHRDISLDNILIDRDGRAVITDFGVAKIIDDSYRRKIDVTVTMVYKDGSEVRMGKERYMAPELKKQGGRVSFASDAWAVGVLLFRMLSGSWYDVGTHLEDWFADFRYDWRPVISQLCNVDPEKRLGEGGIAALPTMVKLKRRIMSFRCRMLIVAGGIIVAIFILLLSEVYSVTKEKLPNSGDESCQSDTAKGLTHNWELVTGMPPRLAVGAASPDNTNVSHTIAILTESVRSNLWTTTLHSKLGLPENGWQGSDIILTLDPSIQFEAEEAVKWGLGEFDAAAGWAIVMDANTGAIYAMVSYPDFEQITCSDASGLQRIYRTIAFNYEPGLLMSVIIAAAAMDSNPVRYNSRARFTTNKEDPLYYKLPGDGSHVWPPIITLRDAIRCSSNIVFGKIAYDLGPYVMYKYMRLFGFGDRTGLELPCEQFGILPDPHRRMWDVISVSRVGAGRFCCVTAIQLVSAYQTIANDGFRMKPYIIDRIADVEGATVLKQKPMEMGQVISASSAREICQIMTDVVSTNGTAPRAAIRGYSVAGKTGTTPKCVRGILEGYHAAFCGIVPASDPKLVVLVTLDFDRQTKFYKGGNTAAPVFKRMATYALQYLKVPPDKPDELVGRKPDELAKGEIDAISFIRSERLAVTVMCERKTEHDELCKDSLCGGGADVGAERVGIH